MFYEVGVVYVACNNKKAAMEQYQHKAMPFGKRTYKRMRTRRTL